VDRDCDAGDLGEVGRNIHVAFRAGGSKVGGQAATLAWGWVAQASMWLGSLPRPANRLYCRA
jgi:hypothetical protein